MAIKAAEAAATTLPMAVVAATLGPFRLSSPREAALLASRVGPWVARNAKALRGLMGVYYERRLGQDVRELRAELHLTPLEDDSDAKVGLADTAFSARS